jgi:hypothetical protein
MVLLSLDGCCYRTIQFHYGEPYFLPLGTGPTWRLQDQTSLVAFVLAMSSASKVELGWDPTIKRYYDGGRSYCDITVHSRINNVITERIYRTSQTLSDHSADALRGRGTRVFEARLLDAKGNETGDPVAIKDVWLDNNRDREGDIMEEIFNEVSSEDKIKLQQYLLTTECHGDVLIGGEQDQTTQKSTFGAAAEFHLQSTSLIPQRSLTSSVGLAPSVHMRAPSEPSREYPQKVHYRIVFKEVGVSLYKVRSLASVFRSLYDTISGKNCLILSGYIIINVTVPYSPRDLA